MAGRVEVSRKELTRLCEEAGFTLTAEEREALAGYMELLLQWNRTMNLVGTRTWQDTFKTLIIDSLHLHTFLQRLSLPANPITWDLGAGAGLPGIPLRICWHTGHYTLVDAREKRAVFMNMVLARFSQPETTVYSGRAELFMAEQVAQEKPADIIVSRAFMPWQELLTFVEGFIHPEGRVIVLTLEPLSNNLPSGWKAECEAHYDVHAGRRYFWSLRPIIEPN